MLVYKHVMDIFYAGNMFDIVQLRKLHAQNFLFGRPVPSVSTKCILFKTHRIWSIQKLCRWVLIVWNDFHDAIKEGDDDRILWYWKLSHIYINILCQRGSEQVHKHKRVCWHKYAMWSPCRNI